MSTDYRVAALVLDLNGRETQVGAHGKVGNGCYEDDGSGHVVKHAIRTLLAVREKQESESGDAHGGTDGKVEVRAMAGDGDVGGPAVHRVGCGLLLDTGTVGDSG